MEKENMYYETEIYEHMKDCDYSRNSHFSMYNKCIKKYIVTETVQRYITIFMTILYILYFSISHKSVWAEGIIKYIAIGCTIILTVLSMVIEQTKYREVANQHWLSAQSYQALYRDCQFFMTMNSNKEHCNTSDVIYRMRKHLNNLNLISPHIDEKINKKTYENIGSKYFHVDKCVSIEDRKTILKKIERKLQKKLLNYIIDVYFYGKFMNEKLEYKTDLDIVIVLGKRDYELYSEILGIISEIQVNSLLEHKVFLNVSVFKEEKFYPYIDFPFNSNVMGGMRIINKINVDEYKKTEVKNNIIKEKVEAFKDKAIFMIENEEYEIAIMAIYYGYYHSIIFLLLEFDIGWSNEYEMINIFANKISQITNVRNEDLKNFLICENYKNLYLYNYKYFIDEQVIKDQMNFFNNYYDRVFESFKSK